MTSEEKLNIALKSIENFKKANRFLCLESKSKCKIYLPVFLDDGENEKELLALYKIIFKECRI